MQFRLIYPLLIYVPFCLAFSGITSPKRATSEVLCAMQELPRSTEYRLQHYLLLRVVYKIITIGVHTSYDTACQLGHT